MAKINVSEVTDILKLQLEKADLGVQFEETGRVLQVSDGVVRIYGLTHVEAGELVECEGGEMAVVMNLEPDNIGGVLLGHADRVKEGDTVRRTGRIASIPVGEGLLGRVVTPLGQPIDGRGAIAGERIDMPLERKAPGVIFRQPVSEPLQTGIKAIDAMIPIGRGQRELIIGDRQTGKTAIAIDTIINQRALYEAGQPIYCIYVAIGQKASSVADIVHTLERHGALPYTTVVAATAADPAALQYYAPSPEPPSANTSATPGGTHWSSTTTSPSRPWPTAKCRCCCAAPPAAKPTRATSSTCTPACSNAARASSTTMPWPPR